MPTISLHATAAQILQIGSTPLLLIPAPPSGFSLNPFYLRADLAFKTTPYNVSALYEYLIGWSGPRPNESQIYNAYCFYIAKAWLTTAGNSHNTANGLAVTNPAFPDDGQAFYLGTPSDYPSNPTLGDSDFTFHIEYETLPTS